MMVRCYISFLGTEDYLPCTYFLPQGEKIAGVRFVQEAMVQLFCKDWLPEDQILIFTTQKAYEKNWLDDGHQYGDGKKLARQGLARCLGKLALKATVKRIDIPDAKSLDEIWQIFEVLFEYLPQDGEIIFDITHAFRSIPMLAMVVLHYSKVLKGIRLRGIYYGAFEVLGTKKEAESIPEEQRLAPIFDLTSFDALFDWTLAIDRFLAAGDASLVCKLARENVAPILKERQGKDQAAAAIKKVANELEALSRFMSTCRGPRIGPGAAALRQSVAKCRDLQIIPTLRPLLQQLQEKINTFVGDTISIGIQAAKWCRDHNLVQQGFTILQEFLIDYIAQETQLDRSKLEHRNLVSQAATILERNISIENWLTPAREHPPITRKLIDFFKGRSPLVKIFTELTDWRNDLNHAGYGRQLRDARKFYDKLGDLIQKIEADVLRRSPSSMDTCHV